MTPTTDFNWTGLYVGAHAGISVLEPGPGLSTLSPMLPGGSRALGATLGDVPHALALETRPALSDGPARRTRAGIGLHMGYNRQLEPGSGVVVGIETDITGLSAPRRR